MPQKRRPGVSFPIPLIPFPAHLSAHSRSSRLRVRRRRTLLLIFLINLCIFSLDLLYSNFYSNFYSSHYPDLRESNFYDCVPHFIKSISSNSSSSPVSAYHTRVYKQLSSCCSRFVRRHAELSGSVECEGFISYIFSSSFCSSLRPIVSPPLPRSGRNIWVW
jgi:hypothetical protein